MALSILSIDARKEREEKYNNEKNRSIHYFTSFINDFIRYQFENEKKRIPSKESDSYEKSFFTEEDIKDYLSYDEKNPENTFKIKSDVCCRRAHKFLNELVENDNGEVGKTIRSYGLTTTKQKRLIKEIKLIFEKPAILIDKEHSYDHPKNPPFDYCVPLYDLKHPPSNYQSQNEEEEEEEERKKIQNQNEEVEFISSEKKNEDDEDEDEDDEYVFSLEPEFGNKYKPDLNEEQEKEIENLRKNENILKNIKKEPFVYILEKDWKRKKEEEEEEFIQTQGFIDLTSSFLPDSQISDPYRYANCLNKCRSGEHFQAMDLELMKDKPLSCPECNYNYPPGTIAISDNNISKFCKAYPKAKKISWQIIG